MKGCLLFFVGLCIFSMVFSIIAAYWQWLLLFVVVIGAVLFFAWKKGYINRESLKLSGNFPFTKALNGSNPFEVQHQAIESEHERVASLPPLAPDEIGGKVRRYHYPDVNIWVVWQYSGQYGKSCKSAGIKRGDRIDLIPHPNQEDPECVDVFWGSECIGHMKSTRLRNMVFEWHSKNYPIFCAVSEVGGADNILLELAFYGYPKK